MYVVVKIASLVYYCIYANLNTYCVGTCPVHLSKVKTHFMTEVATCQHIKNKISSFITTAGSLLSPENVYYPGMRKVLYKTHSNFSRSTSQIFIIS